MIKIGAKFDEGWSFDGICKKCGENNSLCRCNETSPTLPPHEHRIKLFTEKRKNKTVTIAKEFFLSDNDGKNLLKKLKKSLGRGGSFKNSSLELQGEVKAPLKELLIKEGFKVL